MWNEWNEIKMSCVKSNWLSFFKPHLPKQWPNIASLVSKKRFSWKISYMLYWEKFSNKSMERVLRGELTCPLKMFTHANLICHSNFICRLDSRIKNFMKHDQYKKLFLRQHVKKKLFTWANNFSPIPVMYLNVYF